MEEKFILGQKIKYFRELKLLTREQLCCDEQFLTVRQLHRIENGEYFPSIPTLIFISRKLDISIDTLIDQEILAIFHAKYK